MNKKTPLPSESAIHYPLGDVLPELGSSIEVAPGVRWLRMKLPFALDHINLWLLEDHFETDTGVVHGWTAVDCGIANDATRKAWEQIFASHLRGLPIALGILAASGQIDGARLAGFEFAGELSLSGELRPVRGALAMSLALRSLKVSAPLVLPPGRAENLFSRPRRLFF